MPSKGGYDFLGWVDSKGKTPTNYGTMPAENLEFVAQWGSKDGIGYTLEVYKMDTEGNYPDAPTETIKFTDGVVDENRTVTYTAPEGFEIDYNKSELTGKIPATGTLVLKAYLSRNQYVLTVDVDGTVTKTTYYYDEVVDTVKEPTKEGNVEFAGWVDAEGNAAKVPAKMPAGDVFVKAAWTTNAGFNAGKGTFSDGTSEKDIPVEVGEAITAPSEEQIEEYTAKREAFLRERRELESLRGKKTLSASGEEYELFCNIGTPKDATKAVEADGEGVGLFRTEFLFMDRNSLPTEDEQFEAYKQASLILKGKPLIIRTLDIGGDKDIPYLGLAKEENPFMGFRAIRYCLKNRDMFKSQIKAILRASAFGDIRIMFPLITAVEELRQGKELVEEAKNDLKASGIEFDENIQVGVMTETAASGVIADLLAKEADFFSIGTNDLTGYTMAADRGNGDVSYLYSPFQPSVLRMIRRIIKNARENNIPVGMCGEAAANPMMIPLLISFGLTEFSVSAPSVLRVRKNISKWTKAEADAVAEKVMAMTTEAEITEYLNTVV